MVPEVSPRTGVHLDKSDNRMLNLLEPQNENKEVSFNFKVVFNVVSFFYLMQAFLA